MPIDINECLVNNGGCEDHCVNLIGSFLCTCPSLSIGFKANGTECIGMYCLSIVAISGMI